MHYCSNNLVTIEKKNYKKNQKKKKYEKQNKKTEYYHFISY